MQKILFIVCIFILKKLNSKANVSGLNIIEEKKY